MIPFRGLCLCIASPAPHHVKDDKHYLANFEFHILITDVLVGNQIGGAQRRAP